LDYNIKLTNYFHKTTN